jgi:hypothetical protein
MTRHTALTTMVPAIAAIASLWAAPVVAADGRAPYSCGTGTLLNVERVTDTIPVESVTIVHSRRDRRGRRVEWIERTPSERRDRRYLITIEFDDVTYTGESSANAPWDFNPTRLVINDDVDVCIDRNRLVVQRPDGKSYKATIVHAVRERP